MELLHEAPSASAFISLSEHQSQTPSSFYSGPPILYHHAASTSLIIRSSDLLFSPALSKIGDPIPAGSVSQQDGEGSENDPDLEIEEVDVWVTSECVAVIPGKATYS